tara:strand:- start:497 stop:823 length:327 start_codon:yes stop_codon:yes gene_type:complete
MGIQTYRANEALCLLIGQNGFDVVGEHASNTQSPGDDATRWIALQCVAAIVPSSTAFASQFCKIKINSNIGDSASSFLFMQPGDVIYSDIASVVNHTDSNATLLAYRG